MDMAHQPFMVASEMRKDSLNPGYLLRTSHNVLPQPANVDSVLLALMDRKLGVLRRQEVIHLVVVELK